MEQAQSRFKCSKAMKKTRVPKSSVTALNDDVMREEYSFDYRKARRNRFAARLAKEQCLMPIEPDVAKVFSTPESVNAALRAIIAAMPKTARRKAVHKK